MTNTSDRVRRMGHQVCESVMCSVVFVTQYYGDIHVDTATYHGDSDNATSTLWSYENIQTLMPQD